jgi:4-hydroxybenzoate polyprenyltransferase
MLFESLVGALRRNPLVAFALPVWLLGGRAHLKEQLAKRARLDPAVLPYEEVLLDLLRRERDAGRHIVLATASDARIAEAVARHLGLFGEILASDGRRNLKAHEKASRLAERFGERGFDYIGNGAADVPVWSRARTAYVLSGGGDLSARVAASGAEVRHLERARGAPLPLLRVLRTHQWAKNLLLFVALFTAHRLADGAAVSAAMLAFAAFSLAASATYIVNDLADLEHDRRHPDKRRRALASGELPVWTATLLAPNLLLLAFVIAVALPPLFVLELGLYVAATVAYSLWLKSIVLVDVFTLAALYAVRILAGAAAIEVPVSHWLLAFSLFIFLSLALAKRYAELSGVARRDEEGTPGRGYRTVDRALVGIFGAASGQVSVLVFALYITSPEVRILYSRPAVLWIVCPILLYWVARVWLLAYRGELHEDPLIFALRDPTSLALGAATVAAVMAAT